MSENKSASRTVAQKMGVKENSSAFFVNADNEVITAIHLPTLDRSTSLEEAFEY